MALPPPRLFDPLSDKTLLPRVAQIHADCITHDDQLATFIPPLDHGRMVDYWLNVVERIAKGEVAFILQFAGSENEGEEGDLAGYVYLEMPWSETGPFRGIVSKLMVCPNHRRKGVARRVMEKLEEVARETHHELLMLDTTIGTDADKVYPRFGYTAWGVIPKYGISPKDGKTLVDERFYYKDLRNV